MPQNEHIELHRKRHGTQLNYEEKKRKKEAREVNSNLKQHHVALSVAEASAFAPGGSSSNSSGSSSTKCKEKAGLQSALATACRSFLEVAAATCYASQQQLAMHMRRMPTLQLQQQHA
jgi:ribosomal protein S8E